MSATAENLEPALIEQIKALPPQRRKEVKTFVEFLTSQERSHAFDEFLAVAGKVAEAGVPALSPEEIEAEIKTLRAERRTRAARA